MRHFSGVFQDRLSTFVPKSTGRALDAAHVSLVKSGDALLVFELWIGEHAELRNVETFQFDFPADAHRGNGVDRFEHDVRETERVDRAERRSAKLQQELRHIAVNQTCNTLTGLTQVGRRADAVPTGAVRTISENADGDRSKPPAVSMHRHRAARIVDLEHPFVEEHTHAYDDAGDDAD